MGKCHIILHEPGWAHVQVTKAECWPWEGGGEGLGKGLLGDKILSRVLKNLDVLARQTRKNIPGTRVCRGVKKQK